MKRFIHLLFLLVFISLLSFAVIEKEHEINHTSYPNLEWVKVADIKGVSISDIAFADRFKGIAVGDRTSSSYAGSLMETTTGGSKWEREPHGSNDNINGVAYVDRYNLYMVGDNGRIVKGLSGGARGYLKAKNSGTTDNLNAVSFVDKDNGWAVGENSTILKTADGGETWEAQSISNKLSLLSVSFVNKSVGWITGKSSGYGQVYKTTDGGLTWNKLVLPETIYKINKLFFTDENHGWIVGRLGLILYTSDGGNTWQIQRDIKTGQEELNDVFFIDKNFGWTAGGKGTLLYTINGGKKWMKKDIATDNDLTSIYFRDANHGWLTSYSEVFRYSDDFLYD
jgi:photosystem II stability/assembly factor-like uncharacterized protein